MKFYSWNVNGVRAAIRKGFRDWFRAADADVVCLQETKALPEQLDQADREPAGYHAFWNSSTVKKGYSGVAAFSRPAPLAHATGLPGDAHTGEGRLIHLEYPAFHLLACYFPNGQRDQARLDFKLSYYEAFLAHAQELRRRKPVVACGDFNTAHTELDLARPADNRKTSGFLPVERDWLDRFVAAGWVDTFRLFRPEGGHYSWWAPWRNARARNIGWRIDYFFVSEELRHRVVRAWIEPEVQGSDHCPVGLELDV